MDQTTPFTRKIQTLIENTRTTDADFVQALENFSETFDFKDLSTAPHSVDESIDGVERKIRAAVDNNSLNSHRMLLAALREANQQIDQGAIHVKELGDQCEKMISRMNTIKQNTNSLLSTITNLANEESILRSKQKVLIEFTNELVLSKEDENTISSGTISPAFFQAINRLQIVHKNCLKQLETNPDNKLAGEIIQKLNNLSDRALDRLYRFVLEESVHMEDEVGEGSGIWVKQSLNLLFTQKQKWRECLNDLSQTRSRTLQKRFLTALT